jgi:hypothetical protein
LAAVCDGTASHAQLEELTTILDGNAEAQSDYLRYVDMHATLASDDTLFAGDDIEIGSGASHSTSGVHLPGTVDLNSAPRQNPSASKSRPLLLAALVALLIGTLVTIGLLLFNREPGDTDPAVPAASPPSFTIAVISRTYQAVWHGSPEPPTDISDATPLQLDAGLVQIEFGSGAILLAEAPLEAEILSATALRLDHGKVRLIVPSQASGFTVYTSTVKVDSSESEFGIAVNEIDEGEIHAFSGSLELIPSGKMNKRILPAGQALSFSTNSSSNLNLTPRPATPSDFVDLRQLDEQARAASATQLSRWRAYCTELHSDPSLLVHYTFENFNPWDRLVTNTATSHGKKNDGAMAGCEWTRGRWPEKGAADFHRSSHRIRLGLRKTTDAFTLSSWVFIPSLPKHLQTVFSSNLPSSAQSLSPEWSIDDKGTISLALQQKSPNEPILIQKHNLLNSSHTSEWLHLAVTASRMETRFYINGNSVYSQPFAPPLIKTFQFNKSDIGNRAFANTPQKKLKNVRRKDMTPFAGLIDEFQLFSRALSDEEINRIWQAGTPES